MKRALTIVLSVLLLISSLSIGVYAAGIDLSKMTDKELTELYDQVIAEMLERGLTVSSKINFAEGKYIVGEDILPGKYKVTCITTEGESLGSLYSSVGDIYSNIGDDNGLGSLMGSLGGMMETVAPLTIEILGDYGTVLKSYEMKKGDEIKITLKEQTALQISDGTCCFELIN